jgi:predicted hotdog family 3-hydroxylacyl-ACP dehydratase
MLKPAQPDHAWIAAHIPHQGTMCLLDHVVNWDEQGIQCRAGSHRSADNPLRSHDQLGSACGIEYAAQAMAVHGALLAPDDSTRPRAGFLVSVRGTTLHVPRLDNIAADLDIAATCIHSSDDNILYQFTVHAAGQLLLDGRAAVMLSADNQLQTGTST